MKKICVSIIGSFIMAVPLSEQDRSLRDGMVRRWYVEGYSVSQIAKKVEQSACTIYKILNDDPEWKRRAEEERTDRISGRKMDIVTLADNEMLRRMENEGELGSISAKELSAISSTYTKDARLVRGEATEITASQSRPEISVEQAKQVLEETASAGTALDTTAVIGE
jgi:transposase